MAALRADTTPGVPYAVGGRTASTLLDCARCVEYQRVHCYGAHCPLQVEHYVYDCIQLGGATACDAAVVELESCILDLSAGAEAELTACIASPDGAPACW